MRDAATIIEVPILAPTLRERVRWYGRQAVLWVRRPFAKALSADEWYAADCPAYLGQRPPWRLP